MIYRIALWLFKAIVLVVFFAFALNNRHLVSVHFFLGKDWLAPQALVLFVTFTLGVLVGVFSIGSKRKQDTKANGS